MTDKRVLSVQDISCLGQCSLTVALPIISACGVETVILPSAVLSTHTGGFTGFTFRDLTDDIPAITEHWKKENQKFDCLYTGYLGSIRQIDYVEDIMKSALNPGSLTIVDPAMADYGRLYCGFDDEFVKAMAVLCGKADIILPNMTEACFITDTKYRSDNHDMEYINKLLDSLARLGCKKAVLKGISLGDGKIGIAVHDCISGESEFYFTEKIGENHHGTGDCYASAFTGAIMQGESIISAASLAADFVAECIRKTANDKNHSYGVKFEKALPMLMNKLNR